MALHAAVDAASSSSASPSSSEDDSGSEEGDEDVGGTGGAAAPKRRRLAVPACVSGLFSGAGAGAAGGAERHQGRRRRVPHVDGNYPTLVYLPVGASEQWLACAEACAAALRHLAAAGGAPDPEVHLADARGPPGWHVSLSPLLLPRRQLIEPLHARLRAAAASAGPARPLFFDEGVRVLAGREGEGGGGRYFAALAAGRASAPWLRRLAKGALDAAEALGLGAGEPAPEALEPHCSLARRPAGARRGAGAAWTLADLGPGLAAAGVECRESEWGRSWHLETSPTGGSWPSPPEVAAPALCAKVGERVTTYPFQAADYTR